MPHFGFISVAKIIICISQFDFRISLIRNRDRIPSHEQVVIQEYIERVRTVRLSLSLIESNFSLFDFCANLDLVTFSASPS